ncbi:MAG TPA: L-threonylcarbamoyladenylate synthase [Anaerolineae bacterium]|nr:L-threonylcarbamoyladenylate synthase [Anaerolineae bacterium]
MRTLIFTADEPDAIERAAQLLRERQLVAFPTDTVYGLGALAFDAESVAALYHAKERPPEKAIAVLLADKSMVDQVAEHIPDAARRLMDKFWPGALTLIVPKRSAVPDTVSGSSTIGVRVPALDLTRSLLVLTGPLAVTSANRSGWASPRSAAEVLEQLEGRIHAVLDGGTTEGVPSTVVDCSRTPPSMARPGPITEAQLRAVTRLA